MHIRVQLIWSLSCLVSCVHQVFQLRLDEHTQKCSCAVRSKANQAVFCATSSYFHQVSRCWCVVYASQYIWHWFALLCCLEPFELAPGYSARESTPFWKWAQLSNWQLRPPVVPRADVGGNLRSQCLPSYVGKTILKFEALYLGMLYLVIRTIDTSLHRTNFKLKWLWVLYQTAMYLQYLLTCKQIIFALDSHLYFIPFNEIRSVVLMIFSDTVPNWSIFGISCQFLWVATAEINTLCKF